MTCPHSAGGPGPLRVRPFPWIECRGSLRPAELLQGQTGMPDLRHVPNPVSLEFHHVHVVGLQALAGRGTRTAWPLVGREEDAVRADVLTLLVRGERFELVASVRE